MFCSYAESKTDLDNLGFDSLTVFKGPSEVCNIIFLSLR